MGFHRTASRPRESHPTAKNRVWEIFGEEGQSRREKSSVAKQPRRENRLAPTKIASGVRYYGYRYYDPVTGRWPNRDPIQEDGGSNLYGMLSNSQTGTIDFLGLDVITVTPDIMSGLAEHSSAAANANVGVKVNTGAAVASFANILSAASNAHVNKGRAAAFSKNLAVHAINTGKLTAEGSSIFVNDAVNNGQYDARHWVAHQHRIKKAFEKAILRETRARINAEIKIRAQLIAEGMDPKKISSDILILVYIHYEKPGRSKISREEFQSQVDGQVEGFNRIIRSHKVYFR